ncbi:MAG: biopolymer transporter ExbD [Oligoflexia bacterium]|nr:biopolymer transporter ExbD [Oligoflexia bacterium]
MQNPDSHSGKGKQVNFELNLVPFIDLMSTAICFLLMTAVWTQVSMIQIGSSIYGKRNDTGQVEQPEREQVNLRVDVTHQGYVVNWGKQSVRIPKVGEEWDQTTLVKQLGDIKQKYPNKLDGIITVQDDLKYNELIRGMDAMMIAKFTEIAIATQGAGQ